MTEPDSDTRVNATLQQYSNADSDNSPTVKRDPEPDDPGDEPLDNVIAVNALDDPHLQDLAREFDTDELESLVESLMDEGNIIAAVQEATSDDELKNQIDSITDHYAERPSLVEAAGESIAEAFGMRPFDLTITEPDNEYQDPMICLDVDDDVVLTENPELNAELLSHATRIDGVTQSGQRNVFDNWSEAVGGERIVEFKADRDPDALGFAVPGHIPATGDDPGNTPITEFSYIGPATAKDIHPSGDVMSVEDYAELTAKQRAWIDFPVDNTDYDDRCARGIAAGMAEHMPADASDLIGKALNMIDRRDSSGAFSWVNPANTMGVNPDGRLYGDVDTGPVQDVTDDGDTVVVEGEDGRTTKYATEYWKLVSAVADVIDNDIEVGHIRPAFLELPDHGYLVIAPIEPDNDD